eukprot:UN24895
MIDIFRISIDFVSKSNVFSCDKKNQSFSPRVRRISMSKTKSYNRFFRFKFFDSWNFTFFWQKVTVYPCKTSKMIPVGFLDL